MGGLRAGLLYHQPLGISDNDHLAAPAKWRQPHHPLQQTHRGKGVARLPIRRAIRPSLAPLGHHLTEHFPCLVHLLGWVRRLGPEYRDEPVKVRVGQLQRLPAIDALAAGTPRAALAEQRLGNPQGQTLLAGTGRADKQHRLRKPAGCHGGFQPVDQALMAVERW